ncbi:MAG: hypothetical protein ACREJ6_00785 [Candidatus Methylomirabilis sp.]
MRGLSEHPKWKPAGEGYPVRIGFPSGRAKRVFQVVQAESRIVPATEFQPPAGFSLKTFREMVAPW